jgi:hypothetical protein
LATPIPVWHGSERDWLAAERPTLISLAADMSSVLEKQALR